MTALLLDTALDPRQRDYLRTLADSAEALTEIIDDVLDFSKIEAGKLQIEEREFDVRALVDSTLGSFGPRASEKGLELVGLVAAEVPAVVRGDRLRVRQILSNLVGNAMKFTEVGEVAVRVGCPVAGELRFEVADTGVGVQPEDHARIFGAFEQANLSTTRVYGGSGLGLAICKQLVELMGGRIGADSRPGHGSRFWFVVPFVVAEATSGPPEPPPAIAGIRALVVAAHDLLREAVVAVLTEAGMRTAGCADRAEALRLLRDAARDGDGYAVVVVDRAVGPMGQGDLVGTRVLVMSKAGADATDTETAGADGWVTKPIGRAALLDAVVHAIARDQDAPLQAVGRHSMDQASSPHGRVLVVEDNQVNQKVALAFLAALGYEADVANDGLEALDALVARPYDAVLMDCQMPRMDGYEATREIRRREGTGPRTPIVAMTASAMQSDRDRCLAEGMDDHVPKPVRRAALAAVLGRWIDGATTCAPVSGEPTASPVSIGGGRAGRRP